jgi:hypothetical protein
LKKVPKRPGFVGWTFLTSKTSPKFLKFAKNLGYFLAEASPNGTDATYDKKVEKTSSDKEVSRKKANDTEKTFKI